MEDATRHRILVDNPALKEPGWLPPADEVPELAHLRAEHNRLIDAAAETYSEYSALCRRRDAELEARRAAQERGFLGGERVPVPEVTISDAALAETAERALVARDALQTFTQTAIEEVRERDPSLLIGLDETMRAAQAKRAEAEQIMAEADAMEAGTRRLHDWLGRTVGRNVLGHLAYEQLVAPGPSRAERMTVAELHAAMYPPVGFADLDDETYGTDDPDNLDTATGTRPWEATIHGN